MEELLVGQSLFVNSSRHGGKWESSQQWKLSPHPRVLCVLVIQVPQVSWGKSLHDYRDTYGMVSGSSLNIAPRLLKIRKLRAGP